MIIKCLSRKSNTGQLIEYICDHKKLVGEGHKQIIIKHNLRSRSSIDKWKQEFEQNNALRLYKRKDAIAVHHTIISFGKADKEKVNEKMLRDIANEFISLRGKDSLHLVVSHWNTESPHLHCMTSGTKYMTGKGNRLSKADLLALKNSMQAYHERKYPMLEHSSPQHNKKVLTKQPIADRHNSRMSQKEMLIQSLTSAYSNAKSKDLFLAELKTQGYEPYYRGTNRQLTGVKSESGLKFRLGKLGYDNDKLAKLDMRFQEEKALSEIRERQSEDHELNNERSSFDLDEANNSKDQDDNRISLDDLDREDQENETEAEEMDDIDDMEP